MARRRTFVCDTAGTLQYNTFIIIITAPGLFLGSVFVAAGIVPPHMPAAVCVQLENSNKLKTFWNSIGGLKSLHHL